MRTGYVTCKAGTITRARFHVPNPVQTQAAVYSEVLNYHWVLLGLVLAAGMCAPFPVAGLTCDQCTEWTFCLHTAVSYYSSSVW